MTGEFRTRLAVPDYCGLFLVSVAILHLEMVQMRVFSFALWHHLAYLVITIALLGFGGAGTLLAVAPGLCRNRPRRTLSVAALIFAVTAILAFRITAESRLDTFELLTPSGIHSGQLALLCMYYAVFVVPFFAAGVVVACLFSLAREQAYRLYFFNLLGSGAGVVLFAMTIGSLGGSRSICLSAAIAAAAAAVFGAGGRHRIVTWLSVTCVCVIGGLAIARPDILDPVPASSKAYGKYLDTLPDFKQVYSRWNMISRIDVINSRELMLPWLPDSESYAPHMAITIDGDATTWMWHFGSHSSDVCGIEDNLYAAAYHTKSNPDVMIIGLGGGNDIRTALFYHSRRVVGVELNPLIAEILQYEFTEFVDDICYDPGVEINVYEGRSFTRRSADRFDIIQMSGVDTWSGLSSGAYVLSENYLYTVEAFKDYFSRLKPDGILAVNRWYFDPPREMLRMVAVGATAFRELGITEPWKQILVMTSGDFCATLFKNSPWTMQEIARYSLYSRARDDMEIKYTPGCGLDNPFAALMRAFKAGAERDFYGTYLYNIEPVRDDNPFFFDYYKWAQLPEQIFSSGKGGQIGANWPIAMALLAAMLLQAALLTAIFIFFPLARFKRHGIKTPGSCRFILYFICLGTGYMFIEIVLMQKLILYLGHPAYAISVVMAGMLVFSGCGSLIAGPLARRWRTSFLPVILGTCVCFLTALLLGISPVVTASLQYPRSVRILVTLVLIAPPALLMGIPFPAGLKLAGELRREFIPWAWGTNAGATVLASILAILFAMIGGFNAVFVAGIIMYAAAWILMRPLTHSADSFSAD